MAGFEFLLYEISADGILTLTLNRPDCLNAFNNEMSFELQKALKDAEKDSNIRCIILTGAGRAFSAGQDLRSRTITANGTTLAIVEQDINQAMAVADRVYCVREGRIVLAGPSVNLPREEITKAYFGI